MNYNYCHAEWKIHSQKKIKTLLKGNHVMCSDHHQWHVLWLKIEQWLNDNNNENQPKWIDVYSLTTNNLCFFNNNKKKIFNPKQIQTIQMSWKLNLIWLRFSGFFIAKYKKKNIIQSHFFREILNKKKIHKYTNKS